MELAPKEILEDIRHAILVNPEKDTIDIVSLLMQKWAARPDFILELKKKGGSTEFIQWVFEEAKKIRVDSESLYKHSTRLAMLALKAEDPTKRDALRSDALKLIERALEADPKNPQFFYTMGWILDDMDRFDEAISAYETARQINPNDTKITYNIACSYARSARFVQALEELAKIRESADHMDLARQDPDFEALRKDPEHGPRFETMISELS